MPQPDDWMVLLINEETGNELELPGAYQSMRIGQSLIMDQGHSEGDSGSKKQVQGYDDAEIQLALLLVGEDQDALLAQVKALDDAFRETKIDSKLPPTFTLVSPHTASRSICSVIWKDLETSEGSKDDTIEVKLTFVERSEELSAPEDDDPKRPPREKPPAYTDHPEQWLGPNAIV